MASVTQLLDKLNVHSEQDDHMEAFETGSRLLQKESVSQNPKETANVLRKCLVALINLDKYERASHMLQKYKSKAEPGVFSVEEAYIYYRLGKGEGLAKLWQENQSHRGIQHIIAQSLYKRGESKDALILYQKLIEDCPASESSDLSVNERAVISQCMQTRDFSPSPVSPSQPESYDCLFNEALIEIFHSNLEKALELLAAAESKCSNIVSSLSQKDQTLELMPILLQKAFVLIQLNQNEEAKNVLALQLEALQNCGLDDKLFKAIIVNNLIFLREDKDTFNPNVLIRELDFPFQLEEKASFPQVGIFKHNEAILSFLAGKDVGKSSFLALRSLYKAGVDEQATPKDNARKMFRYTMNNPVDSSSALMSAQMSHQYGSTDNAISVLEKHLKHEKSESLISFLLFLYDSQNMKSRKLKKLVELASEAESEISQNYSLSKFLACQILSIDEEKSILLFEKLLEANPDDQLVSIVLGKRSTDELTPITELVGDLDPAELVKNGLNELEPNRKRSNESSQPVSKKRRVRKPRNVPSTGNAENIDPERWLPLKDRSYYKPKKSKKSHATQGGAADSVTEESLSRSPAPSAPAAKKSKKKGKK